MTAINKAWFLQRAVPLTPPYSNTHIHIIRLKRKRKFTAILKECCSLRKTAKEQQMTQQENQNKQFLEFKPMRRIC